MLSCVSCNKGLLEGAKFCKYCGASQSQPKTEVAQTTAASCSACGTPLVVGAKFCRSCGTPITSSATQTSIKKTVPERISANQITSSTFSGDQKAKSQSFKFIAVGFIVASLVGGLVYVSLNQNKNKVSEQPSSKNPAKATSAIDDCVDKKVGAHRKVYGDGGLIRQDMLDEWRDECNSKPNSQSKNAISRAAELPKSQPSQSGKIFVSVARGQPSHTAKALLSDLNGKRVWKYGHLQQSQLTVTSDGEVLIGPLDNEDDAKKIQDSFYNTPYAQDIIIVRK